MAIHNWIRGNDKVPGAWTEACGQVCSCGAAIGLHALVGTPGYKAIKVWVNQWVDSHCPDPQPHSSVPSHLGPERPHHHQPEG